MIPLGFLNTVAVWLPIFSHAAIFGLIIGLYSRREKIGEKYSHILFLVGVMALVFRVFYALFFTLVQYWIWSRDAVGSILLEMPLREAGNFSFFEGKLSYFFFHVLQQHWFNLLLSILIGIVFFLFLKFLEKYKERFFDNGETTLGGVLAFIAGWPNAIAFIGLSFLILFIVSVFRILTHKGRLTTLGLPFLVSAAIILLVGDIVVAFSGLQVLKI